MNVITSNNFNGNYIHYASETWMAEYDGMLYIKV